MRPERTSNPNNPLKKTRTDEQRDYLHGYGRAWSAWTLLRAIAKAPASSPPIPDAVGFNLPGKLIACQFISIDDEGTNLIIGSKLI